MNPKLYIRRKDSSYQYSIVYYINGTRKSKSKQGFRTKTEAQSAGNIKMAELIKDFTSGIQLDQEITFKELTSLYIEDIENKLAPGTVTSRRWSLSKFKKLDDYFIQDITPHMIETAFDKEGLSNNTEILCLSVLGTMFNFAVRKLRILKKNPAVYIDKPKLKRKKQTIVELDELEEIKQYFHNDYTRIYIDTLFYTGARSGEVLGLTPKDITEKYINIDKQWLWIKGKSGHFTKPKTTNSIRKVLIPYSLYQTLNEYIKKNKIKENRRIFYRIKNGSSISGFFERRLKNTKFEGVTPHAFRHSYVSNMRKSGMDFMQIASQIGDTLDTVIKTYSHITEDDKDEIQNIIDEIF